ncbi:BolA family protein [Aliikangiella coralliicola]|uniref:BolA/IbaG family iron-sulfur metabolism protein n=1 Tax=Aliikangiella coralliicola TaxID=2592383 RepID=A0A545UK21_9GAMM|nr:BolA/IbaG family iron-sulfur metabolism protein [Aliikangiella coralliicola]TQV89793.1 BolA/IbaG family iron-sulfur metabolism protein [Aliikangiella coralliicola]
MTEIDVKKLIEAGMDCESVTVSGDGYHFEAKVVSAAFEGKRPVARQQMVYATVQSEISSGELHALSLKTLTPAEAE